jgi:DNA-binding transcriptional LysR family regulator
MLTAELRRLEYFAAVAAELNFSRAAQRIHVVQSALSAAVSRLEKELGIELFDGSKRQIALTAAGEVFLEHAREVIHTARRAQGSQLVALPELMREPMVFVCESGHPLADRARVQLTDLAGHHFIDFPPGWGIRQRLDAGFAAAGVHPTNAYEVADYAITAELIRHRLATTILPSCVANRFPDLRTVPLHPAIRWALSIAYAASQQARPAINALIETLIRHVGQSA